jgi:Uma2 family endonuclease
VFFILKENEMTEEIEIATLEAELSALRSTPKALYAGQKLPLEEFLVWKPREADGWKYEWKDGKLIAQEESMNTYQLLIFDAITRAFTRSFAFSDGATLMPETRVEFVALGRGRQPDIAYFTREQMQAAARGERPIPAFVIEVVSTHDNINAMEEKLAEYFAVGIQCVWYVYPTLEIVRVFTSLRHGMYCSGEEICSAAPAIADFQMTAQQIFAKG